MQVTLGFGFHLVAPGLEMGKAAVDAAGDAAVEPDDGAGQVFQQAAVMADQHDAGAQRLQLGFEPLDGGEVEVVGRLIEQQQVGGGSQGAGKGGTALLPAREVRRVLVPAEAELVEQGGGTVVVVIGAEPGLHVVEGGVEAGQVGFLGQVAQRGAGLQEAGAAIGLQQVGGDLQQRRLAGAVAADKADAFAGPNADFGPLQEGSGAKREVDVLEEEERS